MMVRSFAELEKEIILNAIIEMGSVKQASEALKIPRRTIYGKLETWNISKDEKTSYPEDSK